MLADVVPWRARCNDGRPGPLVDIDPVEKVIGVNVIADRAGVDRLNIGWPSLCSPARVSTYDPILPSRA